MTTVGQCRGGSPDLIVHVASARDLLVLVHAYCKYTLVYAAIRRWHGQTSGFFCFWSVPWQMHLLEPLVSFRAARVTILQWTNIQERITLLSTAIDRQSVDRVKRKIVCKWNGVHVKIGAKRALITSGSFPPEIVVLQRFFELRFQPLSVAGFSQRKSKLRWKRKSIGWRPKSPSLVTASKTQNRQNLLARTSP